MVPKSILLEDLMVPKSILPEDLIPQQNRCETLQSSKHESQMNTASGILVIVSPAATILFFEPLDTRLTSRCVKWIALCVV